MAEYVDALVETAADGVAFDGLSVERDGDGYRFETPEDARECLDESQLRELARDSPRVTNWHFWHAVAPQREEGWAFLRWLEGLDPEDGHAPDPPDIPGHYERLREGVETTWGQLLVTVRLGDEGRRRYEIRHADDADVNAAALDEQAEPGAAREIVRFDERGRYRPLKTAPTLQTGWRFADLSATVLLAAVGYVYPATVENWHRERRGELDVTHWRETIERQTGIYGVVETWDRGEGHEHVEWVAQACCDDSQCLKRRRWAYDDDTPLDADGGDGEFPCREPCSLVISAAREWTRIEGEESRIYEFELTPSEKAQVERIIDAVAEGSADEIREAAFDDGANRWRARFLRAKRFDDGDLGGVPTERD